MTFEEAARVLLEREGIIARADPRYHRTEFGNRLPGHCGQCGLPLTKHVPHQPIPAPSNYATSETMKSPEWKAYFRAKYEAYAGALESLTDDELLAMPWPSTPLWCRMMRAECEKRMTQLPKVILTAWARLEGDFL